MLWELERKRYPQYDHVGVIVAEEISARFFNVISLFNGFIPLIAVQVQAIELAGWERYRRAGLTWAAISPPIDVLETDRLG